MCPLIYEPAEPHSCIPPLGAMIPHTCTIPMYRIGSVWECDECQSWWLVVHDPVNARLGCDSTWRQLTPRQKRKAKEYGEQYTGRLTRRN